MTRTALFDQLVDADPFGDDRFHEDLFEDFLATLPRVGAETALTTALTSGPSAAPVSVAQAAHPVLRRVSARPRLDRRDGPVIVRACRPRSSPSALPSLRIRPGTVSSPT